MMFQVYRAFVRYGLVVLAVGGLGDGLYHAMPGQLGLLLGAEGGRAHVVTLVGMLVVLGSVIAKGLRTRTLPHAALVMTTSKEDSHAHAVR